MRQQRQFFTELYKWETQNIPFIKYFIKYKDLRCRLFELFKFKGQSYIESELFENLNKINTELEDFQKIVLNDTSTSLKEYSENFARNIIYKLENNYLPKFLTWFLKDFINEDENIPFTAAHIVEFNDHSFYQHYGISPTEAERKYRELKTYANNYLLTYLEEYNIKEEAIIKKFAHIGFLDSKELINELLNHETITQKLDYLKTIKHEFYDEFEKVREGLNGEESLFYSKNENTFRYHIFGNYTLVTILKIQEPVFEKYFKNGLNDPKFTFWFLKYRADQLFHRKINSKEYRNKFNSNLRTEFIKAELNVIEKDEQQAKDLLLKGEIDIYANYRGGDGHLWTFNENIKHIEILRVLDGRYYKNTTTHSINETGSDVLAYFKHLLLKPYLEDQLNLVDDTDILQETLDTKEDEDENSHLIEELKSEKNSLYDKLALYHSEVKNIVLTDLVDYPPRIPNSSDNIICYCDKCKSNYSKEEVDIYLKFRDNEIERIRLHTDINLDYEKRVSFGLTISKTKAVLKIYKNPLVPFKGGYEEKEVLYDLNPKNEHQHHVLKRLIRENEEAGVHFNNVNVLTTMMSICSFEWFKKQFTDKISNPLSDLNAVIEEELRVWIKPYHRDDNVFKNYKRIYDDIKSSSLKDPEEDCFNYYRKLLSIEERIKYELFLNNIKDKGKSKDEVLKECRLDLLNSATQEEIKPIENKYLIDDSFIKDLRVNSHYTEFNIDGKNYNSIVPEQLSHDYLIQNFEIDELILDFYYSATRDLINIEEFQEKLETGYLGKIDRTLVPYPFMIFGAYFIRSSMIFRLNGLIGYNKGATLKGKTISYFSDLAPYFSEYASGFKEGFNSFKEKCIDPFLVGFDDTKDSIDKVFEYLTRRKLLGTSWIGNVKGFHMNGNKEILEAFEDGVQQGYLYKAWSIVFSGAKFFKPLFVSYFKTKKTSTQQIDSSLVNNIPSKITSKHHALTYHFENCILNRYVPLSDGGLNQARIKEIGVKRIGRATAGSGFVKAYREIKKIDINSVQQLEQISILWKEVVIHLTEYTEPISMYIKENY